MGLDTWIVIILALFLFGGASWLIYKDKKARASPEVSPALEQKSPRPRIVEHRKKKGLQ